jgi:hypothetical protein
MGKRLAMALDPPDRPDPSPEDPSRFPARPGVAPLDEAPDGHTPTEPTDSDDGSLPPGAPHGGEEGD